MLPTVIASAAAMPVTSARCVPPVAGSDTPGGIVGVEETVVVVVVGVLAWQIVALIVLVSRVTEALRASNRPVTVAPVVAAMDVNANTVPTNTEFVPSVAELVTCQNTLHGLPPLMICTVLFDAVMSVLAVWNTKTAFGSPCASSVSVPVSPSVAPL